ncbi:MAG: response regulator, partial [Clostridia bacterium]|nr:response regulator [Clostridia bacterium]
TKDELDECHTLRSLFSYIIDHVSEEEQKRAEEFFDVDHMLRDFEAGQKLFRHRVPVLMGDGTYRWLQIEIDMIRNPLTGDVEGIMKSEEIEETIVKENMITQVINNDYDYIILIDLGNNSAKAFTNNGLYKPKETDNAQGYIDEYIRRTYVGDDLDTFIQENQFEYIHKRLEKQEKYVIYYYVCEKDGHVRYKKGTYSYPNGDKRYLIFSRFDNTEAIEEQKKINEQLKIALQDSAKANEAKTEIFSRMSHDLRTPMNAIVGMAKLGLDESKDENSRHYFEKIDTSGNYLLGLINDILDMNRLEHEKVVLKEEAADGMEFLYDVVAMMQPLIEQRRINLVTDFSGIRERYLFCDVIRTRQIFVNFLSNAVKFSKPGQTVEWTCKDSKVEDGRVYYEMKFRDYGCGMSKEFLPRVFEPFEQEVNQYSGENPSTGLGLAITKNLVSAMGGDISVESELGQGTTFTLHLSHRLAKASDVKKGIEKVNYEMLSGKRILVVEDHPLNMEIEKKLLEKQAIEVTTANNGLEGVNAFENSPLDHFDAVIMDVRMPVMDGLEATRRIRALPRADAKKVVILATTANAFAEDVKKCLDAGMNAHLAKPIEPKLLYEMLGRLIP